MFIYFFKVQEDTGFWKLGIPAAQGYSIKLKELCCPDGMQGCPFPLAAVYTPQILSQLGLESSHSVHPPTGDQFHLGHHGVGTSWEPAEVTPLGG